MWTDWTLVTFVVLSIRDLNQTKSEVFFTNYKFNILLKGKSNSSFVIFKCDSKYKQRFHIESTAVFKTIIITDTAIQRHPHEWFGHNDHTHNTVHCSDFSRFSLITCLKWKRLVTILKNKYKKNKRTK